MATGSSEEIEEERRLLYVAMTRAKDHLHLIVPQRFYTHGQAKSGDRHVYAMLSRFIPTIYCAISSAAPGRSPRIRRPRRRWALHRRFESTLPREPARFGVDDWRGGAPHLASTQRSDAA